MTGTYLPLRSARTATSKRQGNSFSTLPTRDLVTPRRLDLAVKHRLFSHLRTGGDAEAVDVYDWHIMKRSGARMAAGMPTDNWKTTIDHYHAAAAHLLASMEHNGFWPAHAIPVDLRGELLNGSHRLACAIALGIDEVPVERRTEYCWAKPWNREWFLANGVEPDVLERIERDWEILNGSDS